MHMNNDTDIDNTEFEIKFFESVLKKVPDYMEVIEILGCLYTDIGQIDDGLRMDMKAVKLMPWNPTSHYNLACSQALKGQTVKAIESLKKSIELGYDDLEWMLEDDDLLSLHGHTKFEELVKKLDKMLNQK